MSFTISTEILDAFLKTKRRVESQGEGLSWLSDPRGYASRINEHIQQFFKFTQSLEDTANWEVLTPAAFKKYADERTDVLKLELLWRDMTIQANTYSILVVLKTESLLHSLVRAVNSKDLVAPAMLSRGLLEHAATAYTNAVAILSVFERVGVQSKPVRIADEQMSNLEESLVRAIWGTRIGRGTDAKGKPIWDASPYVGGSLDATNIMTHLQKLSASPEGLDHSVLKVYEWLSDVVHPATQGFRMFWDNPMLVAEGHTRYTIRRQGGSDSGYVQSIALWAAGYSTVVLTNLLIRINASVGAMYKHLDTVYAPFKNT